MCCADWEENESLAKLLLLFIGNLEHLVDISGLVPLFLQKVAFGLRFLVWSPFRWECLCKDF